MKAIKKALCILLTVASFISMMTPAMANEDIKVKIEGELIEFDVPPQIINGRTMVPLRTIFEALGATVDWDNTTQTVTSTKDNTAIILTINHSIMYVNGKVVILDSPACIIEGRTLVPVRAISEAFDLNVDWDGNNNTVLISTNSDLDADYNNSSMEPGDRHYVIVTDKDFSPFEFQDADGNVVGIDIDILAAVAENQGFTYDLLYVGWDAAIAACLAGQADGMMAAVSVTEERKVFGWNFSEGYYDATLGIAVAKDSFVKGFADLKGKKVAVKVGTMGNYYAESIKSEYGFEVVTFPTSPDMYLAVVEGKVDACIDDTPILKHIIKMGELDMRFVEGTEYKIAEYGFVTFDKDNQELIDKFNKGIENIKANGTYYKIIAKYLG